MIKNQIIVFRLINVKMESHEGASLQCLLLKLVKTILFCVHVIF